MKVLDDWKHRRESFSTVIYELTGKCTTPKGAFNSSDAEADAEPAGDVPAEDHVGQTVDRFVFDFKSFKVRKEWTRDIFFDEKKKFGRYTTIAAFDGQQTTRVEPLARNTSEVFQPGDRQPEYYTGINRGLCNAGDTPILLAHGYVLPMPMTAEQKSYNVVAPNDAFSLRGEGAADGVKCLVVRCWSKERHNSYGDLWVDPSRGSLIVQWQKIARGHPAQAGTLHYKQDDGLWLLDKLTYANFHEDRELESFASNVNRVVVNSELPIEEFRPVPADGARMWDESTRVTSIYRASHSARGDEKASGTKCLSP